MNCPICGSGATHALFDLYDDRHGYPGVFKLLACAGCGHRFLDASFSPEQLATLYTRYYPRSALDVAGYRPAAEAAGFRAWLDGEMGHAFRWVPPRVRVLDIGCGFGQTLGYHEARGCEAYGVEADENIHRVAQRFGFKVRVGLFDPGAYAPGYFEYVTLDQVIEHLADPVASLRGIAQVLKPGGKLLVSTPNARGWGAKVFGRRWIHWHAPYHLQHFCAASMRLAAERAGLVLEAARTITSSEWLGYQWIHLLRYPQPGEPSVFWTPTAHRDFPSRLLLDGLSMIHRTRIDHAITRLFDALGLGDNRLFVLSRPA